MRSASTRLAAPMNVAAALVLMLFGGVHVAWAKSTCVEGLCFPQVCRADTATAAATLHFDHLRGQPLGYDYLGVCGAAGMARYVVTGNATTVSVPSAASPLSAAMQPPPPPPPLVPPEVVGCGASPERRPSDRRLLAVWLLGLPLIFWALAYVCEDFLVPSLNLLCDRFAIPEDVAGATILAAGCNAPELCASIAAVFVQHSTVGSGTIVGSASFNILCICGAATLAVGGSFRVDGWLLLREIISLVVALLLFLVAVGDDRVEWYEALLLVLTYVGYVLLCVHYDRLLAACGIVRPGAASTAGTAVIPPMREPPASSPAQSMCSSATECGLSAPSACVRHARAAAPSLHARLLTDDMRSEASATSADAHGQLTSVTPLPTAGAATAGATAGAADGCAAMRGLAPLPRLGQPATVTVTAGCDVELEVAAQVSLSSTGRVDAPNAGAAIAPGWLSTSLVAACRERCAAYRMHVTDYSRPRGAQIAGDLLKRSRFYSRTTYAGLRMSKHVWQQRYFVLDNHPYTSAAEIERSTQPPSPPPPPPQPSPPCTAP